MENRCVSLKSRLHTINDCWLARSGERLGQGTGQTQKVCVNHVRNSSGSDTRMWDMPDGQRGYLSVTTPDVCSRFALIEYRPVPSVFTISWYSLSYDYETHSGRLPSLLFHQHWTAVKATDTTDWLWHHRPNIWFIFVILLICMNKYTKIILPFLVTPRVRMGECGCWLAQHYVMWYDIFLLTAVELTPSSSSTVHIYTQIIHRITKRNTIRRTERTYQ
jgi:hypothetical protein